MFNKRRKQFYKLINVLAASLFFLVLVPQAVKAQGGASLYIEPSGGTFTVGNTFTTSIILDSGGEFINAVEVSLKFDPTKIQVVSPNLGNSFVKSWVAAPFYSNNNGTIHLSGVIPSPGIKTDHGIITTVTFRVKSTGSTNLTFTNNTKVLLNDGAGTDILDSVSGATFDFILPPPAGPKISSPTHPNQNKWYNNDDPIFQWQDIPSATGYSYLLNKKAVDEPDNTADSNGDVNKADYRDIENGIWFFHLKAYRPNGGWGGTSHYQIKIDDDPPANFPLEIEPGQRTTATRPIIYFNTTDRHSGISYYEIKVIKVKPAQNINEVFFIETTSPYKTSQLELGSYDIIARAYDNAGNFTEVTDELHIVGSLFKPFTETGFGFESLFIIPWIWFWMIIFLLLLGLIYFVYHFWKYHSHSHNKLASLRRKL